MTRVGSPDLVPDNTPKNPLKPSSDPIHTGNRLSTADQLSGVTFEGHALPAVITACGNRGAEAFLNFFAGMIRNANTRQAYLRAWSRFDQWCQHHQISHIGQIRTLHVATYIETLGKQLSPASVKQHRAALSKCFDFLVVSQIVPDNPVLHVAGPKIRTTKGKTPTLTDEEFLDLMNSIPKHTLIGLRDRAFIALLAYAWPRVSAAVGLRVKDYFPKGKRWYLQVSEKGGKENMLLVHHQAQDALDDYLDAANLTSDAYIFCSFDRRRQLTDRALDRREALAMVKRRAKAAGLHHEKICNHSFRATGITNYMANGGRLDVAQEWANHSDPRTTGLYDHSGDKLTLEEIERIRFERN